MLLVERVLGAGAEAKIFLCVVQSVMVDVVDNKVGRGGSYLSVHRNFLFAFVANGVKGVRSFNRRPSVFFEGGVIVEVNESESAFSETDSSEREAVTEAAVKEKN